MQDRFPQRLTESTTFSIGAELENQKLQTNKNLSSDFKRAKSMMVLVRIRNRAEVSTPVDTTRSIIF